MKNKNIIPTKLEGLSEVFSAILEPIIPKNLTKIELECEDMEQVVNALPPQHRRPANGMFVEISEQAYEVISGWERSGKINDVRKIMEGLNANTSEWTDKRIAEAEAFLKVAEAFKCDWLAKTLQESIENFENRRKVIIPGIDD